MLSRSQTRLFLATAVAMTAAARGQNVTPEPIPTDVAALKQTLTDSTAKQDQREQAAQRLLSRPDPDARTAIVDALQQLGQPLVQLAAAKALSDQPTADPKLIPPLFALLDQSSSEALIDAAAHALTAFKSDADVLNRLLSLAKESDERVRAASIRAAGTFIDLRVGQTLIDLLDPTAQSPKINAAAAEGLAYLSGLDAAQTTNEGWRAWWNDNRSKSPVQFRADMAMSKAKQYDQAAAAVTDLQNEFLRVLSDQYQRLPAQQKPDTLVRYLRSPEPAVRVVGCRIARQSAVTELPAAAVKDQLRLLIGDASPEVRKESAEAIALINDPAALTPLLTQLNQETDPAARAALIDALRPIGDVRATPILLSMLDDPSLDVVQSAAAALGARDFGQKLRQANPNLAEDAAKKLMKTLQDRTRPQQNMDLRYALLQAMTPLQSKALAITYQRMLAQPVEQVKVRRALLNAIGGMHDPQMADTIVSSLEDNDPTIQLAAVEALGNSLDSLGTYDRQLANLIDPAKTSSQEVRDAAWTVLTNLFTKAQPNQLQQWEIKPIVISDPLKLLVVIKEQRSRARASGDDNGTALRNQQIGDISSKAGLWVEAIVAYQDALTYATQANNTYMIDTVSEGMTKAYLASRQYEQAVKFVQARIKENSSLEGTLGPILRIEAERLVNDNKDYDASLQLIDLALKMNPPLKSQSTQRLEELRTLVQRRKGEQNLTPDPAIEHSQNAMANW